MRRTPALLVLLLLVGGFLVGCGDDDDSSSSAGSSSTTSTTAAQSGSSTTAAGSDRETLRTADVSLGTVLVDGRGRTLYLFTSDTGTETACFDACADTWPPLTVVGGSPVAGEGIDESLLSTASRPDGAMQVTYNGHRLYRYGGDRVEGDVNGQGIGSSWFAVSPAGEAVKS